MSEVRQRKKDKKVAPASLSPDSASNDRESSPDAEIVPENLPTKKYIDREDSFNVPLDIARFVVFIVVVFCGMSYLATSGESWVWNAKTLTRYTNPEWWRVLFKGDELFSLEELAKYDGTDKDKPIYLSINGTVYDVSANSHTYGPGGSYHWFAGVDSSRGFVTGCFSTHRTLNLNGVETMFLPLDHPETDAQFDQEALADMKKMELEAANKKVHDTLKHWVDFFANSDRYMRVGKLIMPEGWENEEPPEWCDSALKGRKRRKAP